MRQVPSGDSVAFRGLSWRRSLLGKTATFVLVTVLFAYIVGAAAGLFMLERISREQWHRQAEINAQIASSTIRSIYTFAVVDTDPFGQVRRIIVDRPLGDAESVLRTGFNPVDVLALAAAQTRHNIWLFRLQGDDSLVVSASAYIGAPAGPLLQAGSVTPMRAARMRDLYLGFARIGDEEHFISALPIVTPAGELLGTVVSSIGQTEDLYQTRDAVIRNSLFTLLAVLLAAAVVVVLIMRRMFRPVPALIQALMRLAHGDIHTATPYRERTDEIGRLAYAIETLREAMAEREHLRAIKEAAVRLEHMAHHDALTGLPNRAFLNKALDDAVSHLSSGAMFNIMLFDLDRFKEVNDSYGHAIGDALLMAVGDRVALLLGTDDIAVRLGGDEFAIVQRVVRDAMREGQKLSARIVDTLGTPFIIDGRELHIGASVGVVNAPLDGTTPHELMRKADIALYAAKHAGRGTYVFYEHGMAMKSADSRMP